MHNRLAGESFNFGEKLSSLSDSAIIGVVIPCYRVKSHILDVLDRIRPEVSLIIIVDDCCPEESGKYVLLKCADPRIKVVFNSENRGVGGATIAGYKVALALGVDIVVKVDGDGQMDPSLVPALVAPILKGEADYTKGNRFYDLALLQEMPIIRMIGNGALSFVSKMASGYWHVMDPTNGFTAIHKTSLGLLPLEKLNNHYFFESDMLFRLNTIRAVVLDMPMKAHYGDEESGLSITKVIGTFPVKYITCFVKRIFYTYFLRGFSIGTVHLLSGTILLTFGAIFGLTVWSHYASLQIGAPTGTIALVALPIILGFQLLLAALNFDVLDVPASPLQKTFMFSGNRTLESLSQSKGMTTGIQDVKIDEAV
jgi:glycosyltransferase involved in cell wall biosynthesis